MEKLTFPSLLQKRPIVTLFTIFTVVLAGCGAGNEEADPDDNVGTDEAAEPEEVIFGVVQDYPPFEYKDENGDLTGYDVELVEAIAEDQNLTVDWKIMKFDGIIPALQAQQIDGAVSAITIRDDRKEVVNFSDPYFESGLSLVVRKDSEIESMEDLEGKTITAKQGTTSLEKAREFAEQYNGDVTVLTEDAALYLAVEAGNADAAINDFPSVAYKIRQDEDDTQLRIVGDRLTGEDYGIALVKDDEELLNKYNEGLQNLRDSGEFQEIYDKYFGTGE
ncbi:basic amino acid ABC transporter substrate-binding protein [Virgibacillus byunsanensis]|uniref:Basic amino acid ABC transporter substrate-binding protein n=1 Tax=Virgibacillus byunsanensis TaxID=570945 RepID=A0ABW3LQ60_9BACI